MKVAYPISAVDKTLGSKYKGQSTSDKLHHV